MEVNYKIIAHWCYYVLLINDNEIYASDDLDNVKRVMHRYMKEKPFG